MSEILKFYPLTHAGIKPVFNPGLGAEMNSRTVVRYLRFLKPVRVDRLELGPVFDCGRGGPKVPTHPAHIIVSALDPESLRWKMVGEADLLPDPRIWGEGLNQEMSDEEMAAHFKEVEAQPKCWTIELGGIGADLLRVECDREHPVWPNHTEMNGNVFSVPFKTLNSLKAYGEPSAEAIPDALPLPLLNRKEISPAAPDGMAVRRVGEMILFEGEKLTAGFALRRPILLHFGWDAFGGGHAGHNRISTRRVGFNQYYTVAKREGFNQYNLGVSGPVMVTPYRNFGSHLWTGNVSIVGNRVSYTDLRAPSGVFIDAVFTVEPDRLLLQLKQSADRDTPVLEAEAWRFAFSINKGMTAVAGSPTLEPGRSGDVKLPALFAGDEAGAITCRLLEGSPEEVHLQAESYRICNEVTGGIALGRRPAQEECLRIPAKTIRATLEFKVAELEPDSPRGAPVAGAGLRRHWTSNLSCYRSEFGGFSNNAVASHCHVNQHGPIEVAAFTRKHESGFNPMDLARFTITRGIMDGSGYGYWRNLYLDSDPVLVSSAGRIHQRDPDLTWLQSIKPGLLQAVERMLGSIGREGLSLSRDLSGNSGSFRASSNAWDNVGFGHIDAYANAFTYRALRNATALMEDLGESECSKRCREGASSIRENYASFMINPDTGWVAGWRSRDNQLHDFASPWINGPACAFGLLDDEAAHTALNNLEKLRDELGIASARLGIPFGLKPIDPRDHLLPKLWNVGKLEPSFEFFTDGSTAPMAAAYYLRALSIHGLKDRAAAIAADLDEGFAAGLFLGSAGGTSMGEGKEFLSWEGLAGGYEGTFGPTFGVLYGIAVEQGVIQPPDPEWWPSNG